MSLAVCQAQIHIHILEIQRKFAILDIIGGSIPLILYLIIVQYGKNFQNEGYLLIMQNGEVFLGSYCPV